MTDDGVPQQIQWRMTMCDEGLRLGGETLIKGGPLYFNARCTQAAFLARPPPH